VRGRLLASLLVCALLVGGGAGVGYGEPRPAERIMPVDVLPLAAGALIHPEPPPTVGPLRKVDVEPSAPPAATGTSPVFSLDRWVPASSPARAVSPEPADTLEPAGGLSDTRSKP
jgi:hypothetical protein